MSVRGRVGDPRNTLCVVLLGTRRGPVGGGAHCFFCEQYKFCQQFFRVCGVWCFEALQDKKGSANASHVAERVNEAKEHTAAVSIEDMLRLLQADRSHNFEVSSVDE